MSAEFHHCAHAGELRAALEPWLGGDCLPFTLLLGIAEQIGAEGWCGYVSQAGRPVLAAAQTPPRPVIIASPLSVQAEAAAAMAAVLRRAGRLESGINGPTAWAEAVAGCLGMPIARRIDLRLHRLVGPPRWPRPCPGDARPCLPQDAELLRRWLEAFDQDIGEAAHARASEAVLALVPHVLLWVADGQPVAMARRARPLFGGCSISSVYTPAALRRRGYGGAVVHALARRLVDEGSAYVALYTDLANPTSNRLYADIGFQPVLDQSHLIPPAL